MTSNFVFHPGLELTLINGNKEIFFLAGMGSMRETTYSPVPFDMIGKARKNLDEFAKELNPNIKINKFFPSRKDEAIILEIEGLQTQFFHYNYIVKSPGIKCTTISRTASEGSMKMDYSLLRGGGGSGWTAPSTTLVRESLEDIREALRTGSELIEDRSNSFDEELSSFKEEWCKALTHDAKAGVLIAAEFLKASNFKRRFFSDSVFKKAKEKIKKEYPSSYELT